MIDAPRLVLVHSTTDKSRFEPKDYRPTNSFYCSNCRCHLFILSTIHNGTHLFASTETESLKSRSKFRSTGSWMRMMMMVVVLTRSTTMTMSIGLN